MNSSIFGGTREHLKSLYLKLKNLRFTKQSIVFISGLIVLSVFLLVYYINFENTKAFKVMLGKNEIGITRDKEEVFKVMEELKKELSKDYGMEVSIRNTLSFEETHVEDEKLSSTNELKYKIKSTLDFNVSAYAIQVNGKNLGLVKSEDTAKEILENIKKTYIDNENDKDIQIEDIKFEEDVKIVKREVSISQVQEPEKVLSILLKGTTQEKTHIVQEGENYWTIAKKYKLTVEDLVKANPDKNSELIHPGDEISLVVPKPYISVITYEKETYVTEIDYETKVEYTSTMYEDETRVRRKGVPGESKVVAKVVKKNGIEIAREILEETVISNPVAQILVKGTKPLPPLKGTGLFINPLAGRITSRFGSRWGRLHEGIDIAARTGTSIKAADGGVVTYAGWKGNYGYLVEIDHGAGFKTRYAHCSKIYVKVGEKVYKGKTIAAVGNTGRSTGPHLHFEVLKNGVPQNPSSYIGKKYR